MRRTSLTVFPLVAMAASGGGVRTARQPVVSRTHTVALATGDDDRAVAAWAESINHDCSDVVDGIIPAGTLTLRATPYVQIRSTCSNPRRHVNISGRGIDSTVITVRSTINNGGGFVFIVEDPRVHVHDMTLIGNADTTRRDRGDGNSGIALTFRSVRAAFGEADRLQVENFAVAGIDIYRAAGVFVHNNTIACAPPVGPAQQQAMGVWVRELQAKGATGSNARINQNHVADCAAEGITMTDVQHTSVTNNVITCTIGHCGIGIALYGTKLPTCAASPISRNVVSKNTVDGGSRIAVGILVVGDGSGHGNRIVHNTIRNTTQHGIQVAATSCGPGHASAFSDNVIDDNDVANAPDTEIWSGGDRTVIRRNRTHVGRGLHDIVDVSGSSLIQGNLSY